MASIKKIKIQGFKKFKKYEVNFTEGINILIGENGSGKSSILDAINIVLNQKYSNFDKYIIEDILNVDNVKNFETTKRYEDLPLIKIEAFLSLDPSNIKSINYYGINHTDNPSLSTNEEHKKYGIAFECCFDEEYKDQLISSINQGKIPFDYYKMSWRTFSDGDYKIFNRPIKILNIDNSSSNSASAYNFYNKNLYLNNFNNNEIMSHKNKFRENIKEAFSLIQIPDLDENIKFGLNTKKLIMENLLTIFEKDISVENMGSGKENLIKTETALNKDSNKSDIILLEEPENHLSHTNLRKMINSIDKTQSQDRQLIITTHNNLIVKQLDISNLIIIDDDKAKTIEEIDDKSRHFFKKSDDNNLLQFLLSKKVVLVEGRSEYIMLNSRYSDIIEAENAVLDDDGIDVISCYGKVYKHYIEVAKSLSKKVAIITDNDGNIEEIKKKNEFNVSNNNIRIFMDDDIENWTFEVCLYNLNKSLLEDLLPVQESAKYSYRSVSYENRPVLGYMLNNKANTSLKIFQEAREGFDFPRYIKEAVIWVRE